MGDRQKVLSHAGITLRSDRQMLIAAIGQRRIAAPGVTTTAPGSTAASTKPHSDLAERSGTTSIRIRPAYRPLRRGTPGRQASRAHPRGKPGFSTFESGCGRETDSLLVGEGFEPSVPR